MDDKEYNVVFVPSQADISAGEEAGKLIKSHRLPDFAAAVHAAAIQILEKNGFTVIPEFPVYGLKNGRSGRLDLVCTKNGGRAAIEIDARKPRRRSLEKLGLIDAYRIVGLRGVSGSPTAGIHAVINIPVEIASEAARQDRKTVNRKHHD